MNVHPTTFRRVATRAGFVTCFIAMASVATAGPGSLLVKQLGKSLSKEAAETGGQRLSKEASEALADRVAVRLTREAGEESIEQAAPLVARGGIDVLKALDSAADPGAVLKILKTLPDAQMVQAASRLAAGPAGKELAMWTTRLGAGVLRAEMKHPGLAVKYASSLGDDGVELAAKLNRDQAIEVARHVDDIARLPTEQRRQLVTAIASEPQKFSGAMGRFVRDNPGKVLFTTATTAVILGNREAFFGGVDADGNPIPGLFERAASGATDKIVTPVLRTALGLVTFVVVATVALAALWLWSRRRIATIEPD